GCQLSFLSVFALIWDAARWLAPRPLTPLESLIEESRSPAVRFLRALVRAVAIAYLISLVLRVVNAPLILYWQNPVSPAGRGGGAVVLLAGRWRLRALAALASWVILGLAVTFDRPPADEARFTFLSVGHGGCVVIETPDGRVILYDAGTIIGPDAVRRVVAP